MGPGRGSGNRGGHGRDRKREERKHHETQRDWPGFATTFTHAPLPRPLLTIDASFCDQPERRREGERARKLSSAPNIRSPARRRISTRLRRRRKGRINMGTDSLEGSSSSKRTKQSCTKHFLQLTTGRPSAAGCGAVIEPFLLLAL